MYLVFIFKIRHKSVSRDNGKCTRKEIPKLFSWNYLTSRWNVEKRLIFQFKLEASIQSKKKRKKEKKRWVLITILLWGMFNEYIKEDIIVAVLRLRKAKKRTDLNYLIFFPSCQVAHEVLRRNVVHIVNIEISLHQRT